MAVNAEVVFVLSTVATDADGELWSTFIESFPGPFLLSPPPRGLAKLRETSCDLDGVKRGEEEGEERTSLDASGQLSIVAVSERETIDGSWCEGAVGGSLVDVPEEEDGQEELATDVTDDGNV